MSDYLVNIGLPPTLAGDSILFFVFILVSVGVGLILGRDRLSALLMAIYISYTVLTFVPVEWVAFSLFGSVIVYLAILGVLLLFGWRIFDIHITNSTSRIDWRFILICFLTAGVLISILLGLLPTSFSLEYLSLRTFEIFTAPIAQLIWVIAPVAILFVVNKRRR